MEDDFDKRLKKYMEEEFPNYAQEREKKMATINSREVKP